MSQAFYTSMTGLNAAQTQLSVVSNNIANLNTTAFKASQVNFSDIYYNTTSYGSKGGLVNAIGGTNPHQTGIGVQIASIHKNFTSGTWNSTGISTDLFINGNGYFTLSNPTGGLSYTRDGSFSLDANGFLVSANGMKVAGTDSTFGLNGSRTPIRIPMTLSAQTIANETDTLGTKNITDLNGANIGTGKFFTDISYIDANGDQQFIMDVKIDTTGCKNMREISNAIEAALQGASTQGGVQVFDPADISVACDATTGGKMQIKTSNGVTLNFKSTSSTNEPGSTDFLTASKLAEASSAGGNTTYETQVLDYKQVIDYSSSRTNEIQYKSLSINTSGGIEVTYSNGDKLSIQTNPDTGENEFYYTTADYVIIKGPDVVANEALIQPENLQIQMACFTNEQGLLQAGNNTYEAGPNVGTVYYGTAASNAFGTIDAGGLEASNVDLAKEFSNMIISQRAIQANSRVFSTASDIMETLSYLGQ